jgi:hypothetical protein
MRAIFLCAGPAALGLLASGAASQPPAKPDLEGEKILARFARCAVRGAPDDARALIETAPGSAAELRLLERFIGNRAGCMKLRPHVGSLQFQVRGGAMRGAIATQLYLDLKEERVAAGGGDSPTGVDPAVPAAYAVVRCAVSEDPAAADRLVRASRLSAEEAQAASTLAPLLNRCGRGRGRIDLSGTALHGWAAEALYKLRLGGSAKVH